MNGWISKVNSLKSKAAMEGFIILYRKAIDLLENDYQAFLLLTHIALRARRTPLTLSRIPLQTNQALIGDYEKIGLSGNSTRDTQVRLANYGLVSFKPHKQGTRSQHC